MKNVVIVLLVIMFCSVLTAMGQNWKDFADKNLDLNYYVFNGNRGTSPEETWYLGTADSKGKSELYLCGQLQRGFSHGKATASGNRLSINFDNNTTNEITITRYDSANSTLYTIDSYGCQRQFKVSPMKSWVDFFNRKLNMLYWRRGDASGTVNGESLYLQPAEGSLLLNTVFTWTGMQDGGSLKGAGMATTNTLMLKDLKKNTFMLKLIGYNTSQNILYAYDLESKLLRAFRP